MATPGPSVAELDEAIIECLRENSDSIVGAAFDRAVRLGEPMLLRVVELYYEHSTWVNPPGVQAPQQMWTCLLFRLAVAHPSVYLQQIGARRIWLKSVATPLSEVVILAHIRDARVVGLLVRCTRHRDWTVRLQAVRGLADRDDAESVAAVEHASRNDCSIAVRVEATVAISRRDPVRARPVLSTLLEHPHLTPMLAEQVKQALNSTAMM